MSLAFLEGADDRGDRGVADDDEDFFHVNSLLIQVSRTYFGSAWERAVNRRQRFHKQDSRYVRARLISVVTADVDSRIGMPRGTGCIKISVQP